MQITTYLQFQGSCAEAFAFYAKLFDGKVTTAMTFGGSPMAEHMPPEWRDKIMHSELKLGSSMLMGTDAPPDRFQAGQGFSVAITLDDIGRAERIFAALAEGGKVRMPLQQTFWAARFGDVVDRFGTPWMISAGTPQG